jgi:methylenetetrahydrofolate reductase (NADPH)
MELIRDIHARCQSAGRPALSFEFFPPKTEEGDRNLIEKTVPALMRIRPDYCSVTYGAGGSTRDKTLGIVERIQRDRAHRDGASHLCQLHLEQLCAVLDAAARGIRNILALRGDPRWRGRMDQGRGRIRIPYEPVRFIRETGPFGTGSPASRGPHRLH